MDVYLVSGGGRGVEIGTFTWMDVYLVSGGLGRDWHVYQDGMMIFYDLRCGATQCVKAAFGKKEKRNSRKLANVCTKCMRTLIQLKKEDIIGNHRRSRRIGQKQMKSLKSSMEPIKNQTEIITDIQKSQKMKEGTIISLTSIIQS